MTITLNRRAITTALAGAALLLVTVHSIVLCIYFYIDDSEVFDFVRLVDLDYEGNIPTLFSALLFLLSGVLLFLIYQHIKQNNLPDRKYWLGLALVFLFLGVDEGTRLHEEIGDLFEHIVEAEGWLYFPWVIPYATLFVIAMIIYFRFYLTLDRWLQIRLFLCAAVFIGGAVGIEMFSAREADASGTSSLTYSVLYTIEESMEMAGLMLLINTLLLKLNRDHVKIDIDIQ